MERAAFVAEHLRLDEGRWDGGAVHADERLAPTGAPIVDRARDQLFACAGLADEQDGCVRGGDGLDLLQHAPQGEALADDVAEAVLLQDLFFQVTLLGEHLILEPPDLVVGQAVLDADGNLGAYLPQQPHVLGIERVLAPRGDGDDPERTARRRQLNRAERLQGEGRQRRCATDEPGFPPRNHENS